MFAQLHYGEPLPVVAQGRGLYPQVINVACHSVYHSDNDNFNHFQSFSEKTHAVKTVKNLVSTVYIRLSSELTDKCIALSNACSVGVLALFSRDPSPFMMVVFILPKLYNNDIGVIGKLNNQALTTI